MENLVVMAKITATSKKNDGEFSQEIPTKTAYISTNEENAKKLEDFGLTKYTTKEKDEYFILKFPQNLMVYRPNGFGEKRPDLSQINVNDLETNNFKTPDDKFLAMNILRGKHKNNVFYRLQALRIIDDSDIEEMKPENPFGDVEAF